jgi:hypothetical protein
MIKEGDYIETKTTLIQNEIRDNHKFLSQHKDNVIYLKAKILSILNDDKLIIKTTFNDILNVNISEIRFLTERSYIYRDYFNDYKLRLINLDDLTNKLGFNYKDINDLSFNKMLNDLNTDISYSIIDDKNILTLSNKETLFIYFYNIILIKTNEIIRKSTSIIHKVVSTETDKLSKIMQLDNRYSFIFPSLFKESIIIKLNDLLENTSFSFIENERKSLLDNIEIIIFSEDENSSIEDIRKKLNLKQDYISINKDLINVIKNDDSIGTINNLLKKTQIVLLLFINKYFK